MLRGCDSGELFVKTEEGIWARKQIDDEREECKLSGQDQTVGPRPEGKVGLKRTNGDANGSV